MVLSKMRCQEDHPKFFRCKRLNVPMDDCKIQNNSQVAKVIQMTNLVPPNKRLFCVDTKEHYMVWFPPVNTFSDDGGLTNMDRRTPLVTDQSVTLTFGLEVLNKEGKSVDDVEIQCWLVRVKRRYRVEVPSYRRPNSETGGDDGNMEVIRTTLLKVTAHCQYRIQIPGQEAVMIPSTDDMLKYGDGWSSKLKHLASHDSGYDTDSPTSLGAGIGDGSIFLGQIKEAGDSEDWTMSRADQGPDTTDVMSSGSEIEETPNKSGDIEKRAAEAEAGENQETVLVGAPEPELAVTEDTQNKPGDIIENESVRPSADGAVGFLGDNAEIVRVQKYIREEFDKVDQLVRGELVPEMSGHLVLVESGEKDVDVTDKNEMLKKENSLDEGIETLSVSDERSDFERCDCCDVLFVIWNDETIDCPAALEYFKEFYEQFSKGKNFVIKTIGDYHPYGVDARFEAIQRASKIIVYIAPECPNPKCPHCREPPNWEKLIHELILDVGDRKDQHVILTVSPKSSKKISKLCPDSIHHATHLSGDACELLKEEQVETIVEKREKTGEFARQHEEKRERERNESPRSSSDETNSSPDSVIEDRNLTHSSPDSVIKDLNLMNCSPDSVSEDRNLTHSSPDPVIESFNSDINERIDVLILCHDEDVGLTRQLQSKIKEGDKTLKIGTQEKFHHHGLDMRQGAIKNSNYVIIYASRRYAGDESMTKALDWEKAVNDIQDKLVVVVPKGTSKDEYDDYQMNLKLVSVVATYFEDKEMDMRPLIKWLCSPSNQAKSSSRGYQY